MIMLYQPKTLVELATEAIARAGLKPQRKGMFVWFDDSYNCYGYSNIRPIDPLKHMVIECVASSHKQEFYRYAHNMIEAHISTPVGGQLCSCNNGKLVVSGYCKFDRFALLKARLMGFTIYFNNTWVLRANVLEERYRTTALRVLIDFTTTTDPKRKGEIEREMLHTAELENANLAIRLNRINLSKVVDAFNSD